MLHFLNRAARSNNQVYPHISHSTGFPRFFFFRFSCAIVKTRVCELSLTFLAAIELLQLRHRVTTYSARILRVVMYGHCTGGCSNNGRKTVRTKQARAERNTDSRVRSLDAAVINVLLAPQPRVSPPRCNSLFFGATVPVYLFRPPLSLAHEQCRE